MPYRPRELIQPGVSLEAIQTEACYLFISYIFPLNMSYGRLKKEGTSNPKLVTVNKSYFSEQTLFAECLIWFEMTLYITGLKTK